MLLIHRRRAPVPEPACKHHRSLRLPVLLNHAPVKRFRMMVIIPIDQRKILRDLPDHLLRIVDLRIVVLGGGKMGKIHIAPDHGLQSLFPGKLHDPIDVFFKNINGGPLPVPGPIGAGTQVAALVHPDVNPPGAVGSAGVFQDLSDITVGLLFSHKQGAPRIRQHPHGLPPT